MEESQSTMTLNQRLVMATAERVVSCFSIAGIMFIILTYAFNESFRRPINRLVFFASFGNLGMNIAALIAEDGPIQGAGSALCQIQGFLIQMFLGVDAYWSLCMAINVHLIFFGHFDTRLLRRLDLRYILCCYGLAFAPSLVLLLVETGDGKIYGDAVLWCWIQTKWAVLRIGLVYSISWIAILLAVGVYVLAAIDVYRRRDQLQPGFMNPLNESPLKPTITTEISVTIESASKLELNEISPIGPTSDRDRRPSYSHAQCAVEREVDFSNPTNNKGITGGYHVDVHADKEHNANATSAGTAHANSSSAGIRTLTRNAAEYHANTEALLYARAAFFYFIALLIIWLPASANRVYSVVAPNDINLPLNFLSGVLLSGQGFLNVIVYVATSQGPIKELFRHMVPQRMRSMTTKQRCYRSSGGSGSKSSICGGRQSSKLRKTKTWAKSEDELGIVARQAENGESCWV